MTNKDKEVVIDANALLQSIANLEKYLENLKNLIGLLNERLIEVKTAKEGLSYLYKTQRKELMISVDKHSNAMVIVHGEPTDKPIIHLGLGIYSELPIDKGMAILESREKEYEEELKKLSKEYEERLKEYQRLQSLIYSISSSKQG